MRLAEVQDELSTVKELDPRVMGVQNGYQFVSVVYGEGDIPRFIDERFGKDVVQLRSTLVPLNLEG